MEPVGDVEMVGVRITRKPHLPFKPHPQLTSDPEGGAVGRIDPRHDAPQPKVAKTVLEHGARSFGGVALAPGVPGPAVAEFSLSAPPTSVRKRPQ